MKKLFARRPDASSSPPSTSTAPIASEYAMEFLSESQKRGVAGLCACLLPAVTDGSTSLVWSKAYLKLLIEHFVGLSSTQTEAYLPILTSRRQELVAKAHEPSSATVEELDPAPFLALVVPEREAAGGFKRWARKLKHRTERDALEASDLLTTDTFRLEIVKRLLWFTVKSVGYDARSRTLLRRLVLAMELQWTDVTREEVDIGQTLYAEATAMPLEKVAAKPKITDWKRNAAIGAAAVTGEESRESDQVDQVMDRYKGREDEFFAILRRTYSIDAGNSENDPLGIADLSKMAVADQDARYSDFTSLNSDSNAISSSNQSTTANTGTSSVWELGTKHEPLRAWRWKDRFPQGDQYCLIWEEAGLRRFGKSMRTFAAEQVSNYATTEIVKYTALAALFAAVAIPRVILRLADIIDNAWTVTMNAADTSGKLLADALRKREQGLRPVTLIGYGMGARLIFSCLKELAKSETIDESCGIVENAVLLGSPVPMARDDWANARRVVSGRLINGYSDKDWMLGVMYRYQGWALNSAGIAPIDIAGVENVDLSEIIGGHLEYKSKIGAIMDLLQLEG
ncbi:hypothetical protein AM588_10008788 [Phytophthora nicotianae]|uniref:DUF726-domain-containing protein n=1 Tax=Phytophthora nicotianae TaxID=4792 RepID=A0A0W8DTS7_PHYNI|nr:hypothetical protein AM588_10008788 [Phytophthora nicotianae]